MKRLLSGCVAALTLLSATPVRADHSALYGTYDCYTWKGRHNISALFGTIWLDGYGKYYANRYGSGGTYKVYPTKKPTVGNVHFIDGVFKSWVAEFTVSNNVGSIHFTQVNNPTKNLPILHSCFK